VEAIGRFSQPPQIGDLEGLAFEEQDLEDLAECRPGRCDVKLSASEIMALRRVEGPDRNTCLEAALRRMLVQRATTYLHGGDTAADPYADDDEPVVPAEVFASLLQRMEFLPRRFPGIADYVQRFPQMRDPHVIDSFLYWSKETLGVKSIVNVTHLTIARFEPGAMPEVMIVAKQVFANHYKNGSITLTAMSGDGSDRYLIYVQRAHVDVLRGIFGGVARRLLERRVKAEAPAVLLALRDRLERIPIETR
jgi:hypothetical protein